MKIGCPREIKPQEFRVGLTPAAATEAVSRGHGVIVESGAGLGAGFRACILARRWAAPSTTASRRSRAAISRRSAAERSFIDGPHSALPFVTKPGGQDKAAAVRQGACRRAVRFL